MEIADTAHDPRDNAIKVSAVRRRIQGRPRKARKARKSV